MQRVKIVLKLLLLLLLVYFLLRVSFGIIYFHLSHLSLSENLSAFYWGMRMDIAALVYINIPFFFYYFIVDPLLPVTWRRSATTFIFSLPNLFFIALNVVDLVYYRYTLRRSTVDIVYSFGSSIHSFGSLFRQYWYVLFIFIAFCFLFVYIVNKILHSSQQSFKENIYVKWLPPVGLILLLLFIARGEGKRPIVPSTALLHTDAQLQPLVNNSTLNLLYSWLRATSRLDRKDYFTATQLDSIYTIRRQYDHTDSLTKRNIIIFILESFSADFFKDGPYRAKTPFFDSLMAKSMVCDNAYANGHESVMGLTAILGSIPPFTDEPLFISNYSAVPFNGIGSLLKEEGYSTSFSLGAEYDHFNFAKLCRMTGLDQYYSKDTYNHPADDDGNWGIYDGYFFPYFGKKMAEQKQPFLSVLFNISSHPPFALPTAQRNQFTIPGQDAERNSITYVDHCFSELFAQVKDQPWFKNSVFVFCADHTLVYNIDYRSYWYNAFHIPLFIYDPQDTAGSHITKPVQQLDIVPSILDKINYSKPFMSFGNSVYRDGPAFSICKKDGGYQLIDSAMLTGFDDHSGKLLYQYNYVTDTSMIKNLYRPQNPAIDKREEFIKAIIQRFNNSFLDHQLMITK